LAARLDLPLEPRAYALFAHCFTCGKDIFAASQIAKALCARGIAALRFDFTGIGASEGESANTNFSSNVQDLIAAAGYLREHYAAPSLLIGHSLGGAAVLAAASQVPEAAGVVTIGRRPRLSTLRIILPPISLKSLRTEGGGDPGGPLLDHHQTVPRRHRRTKTSSTV
jgi:alpha/beta superfamily hydrolase